MQVGSTQLNVTGNRIGADALRELGRTIRTVETLDLGENRVEDAGVACLAGAQAEALRSLSLVRNGMTARALETLTGAPWFGNLTSLNLSFNPLGPAAGLVLGSAFLRSLILGGCGLGDEGVTALAASDCRPTSLDLTACDVTDRGLEALAASPVLARVETLMLSMNRITDVGVEALVRSSHASNVKVLYASNNRIGDKGALALAGWQGPLAFHVENNPITETGTAALEALPARCCP